MNMLYIYTIQSHICINCMHIPHSHSHTNIFYLPDINRTIKVVLLLILLSSIFNILFYLTPVLLAIFLCVYFRSQLLEIRDTLVSQRRFSMMFLEDSQSV